MNKLIILVFTIFLIGISGCKSSIKKDDQASNLNHILTENLDEYFLALTKLKKFNGAVLIQKDGDIILHKAYNINNDIHSSLYVSKNSQFDIHSISKLMAKACIVKLEKEGLINRDDKVSDYIPDFPKCEMISIQHLLDHQSGLPREFSKETDNLIEKTPDELIELIKNEELIYIPGSEALYSNLGYQVIYFIISKVVDKPFVQYLRDDFFEPLGMSKSGAHFYIDKENLTQAVKNHIEDNGEIKTVPNFGRTSKNQSKVYSSLADLLKFINEVKKEPYQSFLKDKRGNIGWSGGGDGILSHAEANHISDYELIFFSNYDEISFGNILADVEKIMTNKPFIMPQEINRKAIKLDRDIIESYVGKYDMAEFNHNEFEIRFEQDSVAFYQNGEFGGMLMAENDSTFFGDPKDEDYFIFRKGQNGDYILVYKYKGVDIVGKKK